MVRNLKQVFSALLVLASSLAPAIVRAQSESIIELCLGLCLGPRWWPARPITGHLLTGGLSSGLLSRSLVGRSR